MAPLNIGTQPNVTVARQPDLSEFAYRVISPDPLLEADRVVARHLAPPGVLIDSNSKIIRCWGEIEPYLNRPGGLAGRDVLMMARASIVVALRSVLKEATGQDRYAKKADVRFKIDGHCRQVDIEVLPLTNLADRCYVVLFIASGGTKNRGPRRVAGKAAGRGQRRIDELERELSETRADLETVRQTHRSVTEQLQTTLEELQTTNEELQSTNESIAVAKDILETNNRKLATDNAAVIAAGKIDRDESSAKDDFLAALSHELRTPLNPVLLIASEAATNASIPANLREDFAMIARNVAVETRLIDDLLDVSLISRGKLKLLVQPVNLVSVLESAIAVVDADFRAKHIELRTRLPRGPITILGDSVRLQQLFWNVLRNAAKFTPARGCVSVEMRLMKHAPWVNINVTDSGIGMTPAELVRIFDAFTQGDHAAANDQRNFGGLGLGLAISRKVAELQGGSISATSPGPGKGATFTIVLSTVMQPAAVPREAVIVKSPPSAAGRLRRILLVDDHEPTRSTFEALLTRRGYIVSVAGSAAEARLLAGQQGFNLVITDIGLPDATGHQLMTELKSQYGMHGIAVTGYGTAADVLSSIAAGFDAHLTKPIDVAKLEDTLARVFEAQTV